MLDPNSMSTFRRRAAELASRTGNPLKVLNSLNQVSEDEMVRFDQEVRKREGMEGASEGVLIVSVDEASKNDPNTRQRLF